MTDMTAGAASAETPKGRGSLLVQDERTRRRNAAEKRFQIYGAVAVSIGLVALVALLISIIVSGAGAFQQTFVQLPVTLEAEKLDKTGNRDPAELAKVTTFGYAPLIEAAMEKRLAELGIAIPDLSAKDAAGIISQEAAAQLRNFVLANPDVIGQTVDFEFLASGRVDGYLKGRVSMESAALDKNISPAQLQLVDALRDAGVVDKRFNWGFITMPDASDNRPRRRGSASRSSAPST